MDQLPENESNRAGLSQRLAVCLRALIADPEQPDPQHAEFLDEKDLLAALQLWLGDGGISDIRELRSLLVADIARIDLLLNRQVNAILHHGRFQQLEASWRGLRYLTEQHPVSENVKIRVLNVSRGELARDADRAIEFDQTQLFKKVYEEEFGSPGGEPYGLLLCDFDVQHRVTKERPVNDIQLLHSLIQVAAAAFAPVLVSAAAGLFGLDSLEELERRIDLPKTFAQVEYIPWRSLRDSPDSRYLGVTLPRTLMRRPYIRCTGRVDDFVFEEDVLGPDNSKYLWGNSVYAFGAVAMRSFAASGWFENIVGIRRDDDSGGLVTGLPTDFFVTDSEGTASKFPTDVVLTDGNEREFASAGFIPLCRCTHTNLAAFYSCQTVQKAAVYDRPVATRSAQLSTKLNLMLCVSRFAHYIKVVTRDRTGSYKTSAQLQTDIHTWIHKYVSIDNNMSADIRHRFPLHDAKIEVREILGKPGTYLCIVHLRPQIQGETSMAAVRLVTELMVERASTPDAIAA